MADFEKSFPILIKNEGKYGDDPDDPGGETYKGIARRYHSKWEGWHTIDMIKQNTDYPDSTSVKQLNASLEDNEELQVCVKKFYEVEFWDKVRGDDIENQEVAHSIFDFGVNAHYKTSIRLAQVVVDTSADGIIGPNTLKKINEYGDHEKFLLAFGMAKIARYTKKCWDNPKKRKFYFGWINRVLEGV